MLSVGRGNPQACLGFTQRVARDLEYVDDSKTHSENKNARAAQHITLNKQQQPLRRPARCGVQ